MPACVRDAVGASPAPVVALSPLVRGEVLKGPTAAFMRWSGQSLSSDGRDNMCGGDRRADEQTDATVVLQTDVLMDTPAARRRLAHETLDFALALR